MPDQKISDLAAGDPLQPTDELVVARAGSNFKIDGSAVVAAVTKHDVTLAGNTAGALALVSSGTLTLAGGNNITLSQAGNAVTISGPNVAGAQTGISGIANSETTYTSGTVSLSELGAITIRSTTGQQFQFSVNPQSVQPETQTFIGGISASDTLYTSGTVRITGVGGGVTVSSNTGQRIDISVAAQSVQPETQTFIGGISASDTLYTSGTVRFTGVGGGVTVSTNTGQRVDISVAAQSVQPETQTFVGGIGNSQTTYTSGTVNLSVVAGNLTIRSTTGQAFQFSMSQSPETQTAISGIANSQTTYTSGTVSLSELGAITIRSTTGNQYQFSVNSQTVQTQGILSAGVSSGGNTAGNTTVNTGSRFVLVASGNATASQATAAGASTVTISVGTQTVQTQDVLSIGVSTGGNTAGNTTVNTGSRFVIVGSNGITASQGTAAGATTVTLSGVTQSVQTNDIPRLGVSTGGNTAGDTTVNSGTRFVLVGSNMISLSQGTAASATTITINATQTAQTQGIINAGVSTGGNTSGDTTVNSGTRLVFAGGNNITLSQGTAANATTITISAGAGGAGLSAGMSTNGNTSGDTGLASQRLALIGGNNITLSGSTNGGSMSITVSAPNLGAGAMSAGASNLGNTAGSTGITGTQLVLVGSGVVSLSQSTGANGGTLSINAPATSSLSATGNIQISTNGSTISIGDGGAVLDFWDNLVPGASTTFQGSDAALHIYPLNPANGAFPGYMSVSSIFFDITGTVSTAAAFTRSFSLAFYTRVNSTQLSRLYSASTSWGTNAGNMLINDSMAGRRWVTFNSSQFNTRPDFHEGSDYFMAVWQRSSSGSQSFSYLGQLLPYYTGIRSGIMGAASATNTTLGQYPFLGNYSVSFTTAMPDNIAASDVNKSNATAISLPRIIFNNVGTQIV